MHEVDTGHTLGDRVLHLQPLVQFEEEDWSVSVPQFTRDEKLHRACPAVLAFLQR